MGNKIYKIEPFSQILPTLSILREITSQCENYSFSIPQILREIKIVKIYNLTHLEALNFVFF